MTLRSRTHINILVFSILLISLIFIASRFILLKNLSILEQDFCLKNVQRVINVITNDNSNLLSTAGDYAAWDDTYNFASGNDAEYLSSNIIPETMIGLNLNYFIFMDNSGQIYDSFGYDLNTNQPIGITWKMKELLSDDLFITKLKDNNNEGFVGILQLESGPLVFAAHPILTSKHEGPRQGSLIIGRYIDDKYAERLSESTQSDIQLSSYSESQITQEIATVHMVRDSYPPIYMKEIDSYSIAGYTLLQDIYDKPAIIIRTMMEREIYRHGYSTVFLYVLVVTLGCLFFSLGITFFMNRQVISRIADLNKSVKDVSLAVQPYRRVSVNGKDEITSLAFGINEMLESLEESDFELRKSRDELEKRIIERTSELSRVNFELNHEIRERELSEKALYEIFDEKNQILSSISSIIIGVDNAHQVTQWNDDAGLILGLTVSDVMGRDFFQLPIVWDWGRITRGTVECTQKQEKIRMDDLVLEISGQENRILSITLTPLYLKSGEEPGFLLVATDITERRLLEHRLGESKKMEAIGQMAAGIAHEINTPTQLVGSNLRYIEHQLEDVISLIDQVVILNQNVIMGTATPKMAETLHKSAEAVHIDFFRKEAPKAIADSLEGIERISHIVSAMRYYSHPGRETKELGNLNQIIQNALTLSRNEWKNVAEIKTDLATDLPSILCLPSELSQVILNLIINAVHAIRDVIKENPASKGLIIISSRFQEGFIEIRISDTGTGIPEEIRNKIFNPFFTTKDVGIGTGQGLAICYTVVVKEHNGTLDFESEVGKGSTFIIRIPGQIL